MKSKYDKDEETIVKIIAEHLEKKNNPNKDFQEFCELNGYKVRTGQWKWVRFKDGYCIFDPHIVINGTKITSQEIHIKNSNEMIGEYIKKHNQKMPLFTWTVNKDNKAVVDNTFISSVKKIINKVIQLEYKEFRKDYNDSWFKLNWKDVKKNFVTYTIQPNLECPTIKPIQIMGDMFSPSVEELIKYRSQLPVIQYKVSGDFSISQFSYDEFYEALDICKEILIKKYGEEWKKRRIEKYENKIKTVAVDPKNIEKKQEGDSSNYTERLAVKVMGKSLFTTEFELQWDDIKFYNGYYVFEPNLESIVKRLRVEPLRKENSRCRASFRSILNHFKNQMPKITYRITKDFKIKISNEPDFEEALIFLTKENRLKDIEEFEHIMTPRKISFDEAMARAGSKTVEELIKNKTDYFNFLIAHQMREHRVVPVTESLSYFRGKHNEDSFMFTLKSYNGKPFIIVENVNIKRATMIFKASIERYDDALRAVFDYVQSDWYNKRSTVRGGHIDFKNSGVVECKSVDHNSFDEWKHRMLQYFK